jgi:hypothetical protein
MLIGLKRPASAPIMRAIGIHEAGPEVMGPADMVSMVASDGKVTVFALHNGTLACRSS